ncbi:MAG TPA: hypothetical protein DDZ91_05990, partial [Firmicutes bacterium]|nr:hypothetical protein [Bacillota bacterium]
VVSFLKGSFLIKPTINTENKKTRRLKFIERRGKAIFRKSTKEWRVSAFFKSIAHHYDLVNTIASLGQHHHWRKFTVEKTNLSSGQRVLDVCCGTGMITKDLARKVGPRGNVVGLDLSPEMLAVAEKNLAD